MLVSVLTIERNDLECMSLPAGKRNKERGNDYALPVSRILWNCLEDSKEFYHPGVTVPKREIVGSGSELEYLPAKFEKVTKDSDEENH